MEVDLFLKLMMMVIISFINLLMDTLKAVLRGTVISHLSHRRKKKSVTEAARIAGRLEIGRKRSLKQPTKANLRKVQTVWVALNSSLNQKAQR